MKRSTFLLSVLFLLLSLLPGISRAQQTILVFGDSLSAAYGMPREAGWVSLLQQQLKIDHPDYQVVNASVSGETTAGGLRRLTGALREHQPSIVILELGANDGLQGTPTDDIELNLGKLIKMSRRTGAEVLLLGMQLPPNYGTDYTARFKSLYSSLAKQYNTELVPFFLDGIAPKQFQADNLHPTEQGQAIILQNIWPELEPLL